jgi:hypothetical protein
MKKIVAISVGIIALLVVFYCCIVDSKRAVFNLDNGVKVTTIMEYNKLSGVFTSIVRVENKWVENGFLEFINPVLITVSGLTENNKNILDVKFRYRTFTYGNGYYESMSSTDRLQYKHFKEIKRVEISTLMENW